jgi:large subunit ribosomal protein L25
MAEGKRPTLAVEERPERGSRATRRLRRQGLVPGVVYGGGSGDCVSFKVDRRVLRQALVHGSALIDLEVGGKTRPVIVKDQQLHPVREEVMHIDRSRCGWTRRSRPRWACRSRAPRTRRASRRAACSST